MLITPQKQASVQGGSSAPVPATTARLQRASNSNRTNDSQQTSSVIYTVVDTEWNNMLDVYDIVWIEVTGNGDVVKRVERILIQSRNVHCERQFGTNITVSLMLLNSKASRGAYTPSVSKKEAQSSNGDFQGTSLCIRQMQGAGIWKTSSTRACVR